MGATLPAIDPDVLWGLLVRGLAGIYVIALISLRIEILAICGSRGVTPLALKLSRIRSEFGFRRAVLRHPSLFWISASDRALRWLPVAGIACAGLAVAGYASPVMLAICWVIYLSLDIAIGLTFPWESLLFEAGLLAVLLPPLELLPSVRISSTPSPVLLLAFLWLLFRVIFGFGKNKFTAEAKGDPVYLRGFLISQPMASPLGWLAFRLPRRLLVWSNALLFVVEMVLPFFVFFAGWPRLIAAAAFCGLMLSIQLMGNFGFFNLLVMVLCLPLLDARAVAWPWQLPVITPSDVAVVVVVSWALVAGVMHLPFNSFVARSWPEWPAWAALPRPFRAIAAILRAAMPFRTVHAYGVFPPQIGPPVKWLPIVEGTRDGVEWVTYEYRYMPSTEWSRPRFVAPHAPRFDHFAIYEGCAVGHSNFLGTLFGQGNAYDFGAVMPMDRLLQRLLERSPAVLRMFRLDPFNGAAPLRLRMRTYAFTPTTLGERARTGKYWHKTFVHEHAAERERDDSMWQRWPCHAEQFHPDERWSRRRAPRLAPLLAARDLGTVRRILDTHTAAEWAAFWEDWVPGADTACDRGWPAVAQFARGLRETMSRAAIDRHDRIRGAVTSALLERIEPHLLKMAVPPLVATSHVHASLLAHAVVFEGAARVDQVLRDPLPLLRALPANYEQRGLMLLTTFYYDMLVQHARAQRIMERMQLGSTPLSPAVPGFAHLLPMLAASLPDPAQQLPNLTRRADGEWHIDGVLFTEPR